MEELLTLRGVARKTANVVLGNAYGINMGVVVDTHVILRAGDKILMSQRGGPHGYGRWHLPSGKLDAGLAIFRDQHVEATTRQPPRKHVAVHFIVFHQKDRFFLHRLPSSYCSVK
jgi:hypothetical protein